MEQKAFVFVGESEGGLRMYFIHPAIKLDAMRELPYVSSAVGIAGVTKVAIELNPCFSPREEVIRELEYWMYMQVAHQAKPMWMTEQMKPVSELSDHVGDVRPLTDDEADFLFNVLMKP